MMRVIITPGPLKGELDAIPSKSDAHRAVLAAALSDKPTDLILPALSQDIEATIACVAALGAAVVRTQTGLRITPRAQDAPVAASLFFGESGTTARLVLPVAAALCERVEAGGAGRLPARPMAALCRALSENGCRIGGDRLPLSLRGPLQAGVYELPGNISSQYVSGLLFALPLLEGDSVVALTSPLQSSGYVDMTIQTLAAFGIEVCARAGGWLVQLMPGVKDSDIDKLEANLAKLESMTAMLDKGMSLEDIIRAVLDGFEVDFLQTSEIGYRCACSREKVERALISMGKTELRKMAEEQENSEVTCQFCDKIYRFSRAELQELLTHATK